MADEVDQYEDVKKIHIERGANGFGFNIKGTTQVGGTMHAVNGRLYPPLQYISHVDQGGSAWEAGLRKNDRILEVNGLDARGAAHADVVKQVIKGGGILDMIVLSVDEKEAERLQRLEEAASNKRQKNQSSRLLEIRDYDTLKDDQGKPFTVYNVYVKGSYRTSKRFSELQKMHYAMKARFRWHKFPAFPGKKLNGLTKSTLSVDDIFKSDEVAEFLKPGDYRPAGVTDDDENDDVSSDEEPAKPAAKPAAAKPAAAKPAAAKPAAAKPAASASTEAKPDKSNEASNASKDDLVLLPNNEVVDLSEATTAGQAIEILADSMGLSDDAKFVFRLFTADDGHSPASRTRPAANAKLTLLEPTATLADVKTHIVVRRWFFSKEHESRLDTDDVAVAWLFHQTRQEIEDGTLFCGPKKRTALDELASQDQQLEYLQMARKLHMYGGWAFKPCTSDHTGEEQTVCATVTADKLILQPLTEDGQPSTNSDDVTLMTWDAISKIKRRDDMIGIKATVSDEPLTFRLTSENAGLLEAALKRAVMENEWQGQDEAESLFFG
ncbi:uncharacterized protein MONBRDRAFT_35789 [Monosiga brevicollis MX1]|uniref:PDZ domain-containing protein n=1 Tax=Monosiga brevicollis TaxID=81824 RepID=A9URU5_MONBE|nr:uncharacterized protein MONBRDRAFT_35789 [Monosiga brevicollis MX1]EDQ91667.1 predicted protein [Monosiga brevicollis MX1]|eukprot:XP_001742953.1 hypothetical protein [Monosiga brevicollis MX1]